MNRWFCMITGLAIITPEASTFLLFVLLLGGLLSLGMQGLWAAVTLGQRELVAG